MKELIAWILGILTIIALVWLFAFNGLAMMKVINPMAEDIRRDTFENTKSYRDGMVQELRAMQLDYIRADDKIKPALAQAILHKAAGVPEDALPSDLRSFLATLRP